MSKSERCSDVPLLISIFSKHVVTTDPIPYTDDLSGSLNHDQIVEQKAMLVEIRERAHPAGVLVQKPCAAALTKVAKDAEFDLVDVEAWADLEAKKIRAMCRHLDQAIGKSTKSGTQPEWLQSVMNATPAAEAPTAKKQKTNPRLVAPEANPTWKFTYDSHLQAAYRKPYANAKKNPEYGIWLKTGDKSAQAVATWPDGVQWECAAVTNEQLSQDIEGKTRKGASVYFTGEHVNGNTIVVRERHRGNDKWVQLWDLTTSTQVLQMKPPTEATVKWMEDAAKRYCSNDATKQTLEIEKRSVIAATKKAEAALKKPAASKAAAKKKNCRSRD